MGDRHLRRRLPALDLGLHAGEDEQTFNSYIKSLRRDGVPFATNELGVGAGHNLTYRYPHLMELAVALALRTQGVLSRHIVGLLAQYRSILRSHYRQAWLERDTGLGKPRKVVIDGNKERRFSGAYLDLHRYLSELERLPTQLYWSSLDLEATNYPRHTLKLVVYTLSLDPAWLNV